MSGKCYASKETCPNCGTTMLIDSDTQSEVGMPHSCGKSPPLTLWDWVKIVITLLVIGLIVFNCVYDG